MEHKKCGTEIPDSECTTDVFGRRIRVYAQCPTCLKKVYLGSTRMTDEQYNAAYHDMPLKVFRLAKVFNHSPWCP